MRVKTFTYSYHVSDMFAIGIAEAAHHKRTIIPTYPKDPLYPPNSVLRSTKLPPLRHWRFALLEWAEMRQKLLTRAQ